MRFNTPSRRYLYYYHAQLGPSTITIRCKESLKIRFQFPHFSCISVIQNYSYNHVYVQVLYEVEL